MSVGTGRQNIYNSVLEITDSFLGVHEWKPDIYIGSHRPFICSAWRPKDNKVQVFMKKIII
jgi:hypothetical protein